MSHEKPHILLVEDEIHLARGICFNLELEEYRVSHVESGEEALERVKFERFDLIILDVMLPGIDGFAVCREIRTLDARVPVLMLTARSDERDRIAGLADGYDLNFVLDNPEGKLVYAGCLSEETSGRKVEVYTTQPGIQLYTGYWIPELTVDGQKTDVLTNSKGYYKIKVKQGSAKIGILTVISGLLEEEKNGRTRINFQFQGSVPDKVV